MNKVKKALLATSMAGALVVSAGYGTYSWFTAEKAATGVITNGTLTLGDASNQLFNHEKFAPSQLLIGNWTSFANTGNLDQIFKVAYDETLNMPSGSLGNYGFQGYVLTVPTNYDLPDNVKAWYETAIKNDLGGGNAPHAAQDAPQLPDGSSVQELDSTSPAATPNGRPGGNQDTRHTAPGWELSLPVGYKAVVIMGVKLNENAGNDYQAAVYNGTLTVDGKQTDAGAQYQQTK